MEFYNALQMDPSILKRKITATASRREKAFYWTAMTVRAFLIVIVAVAFIGGLSLIFGKENIPMGVVIYCILLGIRFVNFEYCTKDSAVTLAASMGILAAVPTVIASAPAAAVFPLHLAAAFILMYMTSQRPELGNGGIYSFAYIYMCGNPVYGDDLKARIALAVSGYILCVAILFLKHREKHTDVRFHHVVKKFSISNIAHLWQMRMAIGIAIIMTAGQFLGVERFMWMGFACASLLSEYPYSHDAVPRMKQRIVGVIAGSSAYFLLYNILPAGMHFALGSLGGIFMGFCTDYRYKTAANCFGALMLATGIYGIQGAVILRITDTILGVIAAVVIAYIFHIITEPAVCQGNEESA